MRRRSSDWTSDLLARPTFTISLFQPLVFNRLHQPTMEFQVRSTVSPPKNLYPCLATITITPTPATDRSRRLSSGSQGGGDDDGNALRRVISGGRRKSSFGTAAVSGSAEDRRRSIEASRGGAPEETTGKWYWRVQAGSNEVSEVTHNQKTETSVSLISSCFPSVNHPMPS